MEFKTFRINMSAVIVLQLPISFFNSRNKKINLNMKIHQRCVLQCLIFWKVKDTQICLIEISENYSPTWNSKT